MPPISQIDPEDRPRERLLRSGGHALSDAELLAVLLRTGRRGFSALEMAKELLMERGGLSGLLSSDRNSLRRKGLGDAKLATLMAALEVGRRLARRRMDDRDVLARPAAMAAYLMTRYQAVDQEVMGAVFLDARNRLLGDRELFRGTLSQAAVEPRAILKTSLELSASGVVLFHTHPSGDPSPSVEDLAFTDRMVKAGRLLGIECIDHLILAAGGRWVSLRRLQPW